MMKRLRTIAHVVLRRLIDWKNGVVFSRTGRSFTAADQITVSQPFTASATLEQKKHNLRLAASRIARHTVLPGEVFSFWNAVGNPNTDEWEASRSIVGGKLIVDRGGGLCQASGIIHHLSLIGGLEIVERHNHSVDLYTEETRFCPLGSDATVCYGYRDLRVANNTPDAIAFELVVHEDRFEGRLLSEGTLTRHEIVFERIDLPDGTLQARVIDQSEGRLLNTSQYDRLAD